MKIQLIDDHAIFRSGLRQLIRRRPGLTVAAETGSVVEALAQAERLQPEVIVADIHLADGDGIDLAQKLRASVPGAKIVFLSSDSDPALMRRAIAAGGRGYVLKDSEPAEVVRAIEAVAGGGIYLCERAAAELLARGSAAADAGASPGLSAREQEVLRLIVDGLQGKEIAARLGVSTSSAETYRARLMRKLGCRSTAELVRRAVTGNLLG